MLLMEGDEALDAHRVISFLSNMTRRWPTTWSGFSAEKPPKGISRRANINPFGRGL